MSVGTVYSAALQGLEVKFVQVEADLSAGLPMFHMVGYLAAEVKEAGERVRTAIRNSGITFPPKRTVINLSPGNIRKRGSSFDLAIALSILVSLGEIPISVLESAVVVGELGLDGSIRQVAGVLPIVWEARKQGMKMCLIPVENREEAALVDGIRIYAFRTLRELWETLSGGIVPQKSRRSKITAERTEKESSLDFADVKGQKGVKRAAEIAVSGGHNLLMIGPPGSGKSMIASRVSTILPPLTEKESIELTKIYSVQGLLQNEFPLITKRPFREVHHTVTKAALIGGGQYPVPGEITMADKGVLFLDELTEFARPVLEVLRQPLEEKRIRLVRKQGVYIFPADFMLVAAMNPCPCGYYPDLSRCSCTSGQIQQYLGKISQPLLSRIDLCIDSPGLDYGTLRSSSKEESSAEIRARVCEARERQRRRYKEEDFLVNALIPASRISLYCSLGAEEERVIKEAFTRIGLTARTYHKTLKVARTIADLAGQEKIGVRHLREAIAYRMPDQRYWGNLK